MNAQIAQLQEKKRKKKFSLPKEVREKIKTQKESQKTLQFNRKKRTIDTEFEKTNLRTIVMSLDYLKHKNKNPHSKYFRNIQK